MRNYIFTQREHEIVEAYLKRGLKLDGFQVLAGRVRKNTKKLMNDMELLRKIVEKLEESSEGKA
jgi:hypothetical protein